MENKKWYLASKNDGLFIINAPPRPSTDDEVHDRADGPTMVVCVSGLDEARAASIVAAHNATLS